MRAKILSKHERTCGALRVLLHNEPLLNICFHKVKYHNSFNSLVDGPINNFIIIIVIISITIIIH
jgi:hypothetical protein